MLKGIRFAILLICSAALVMIGINLFSMGVKLRERMNSLDNTRLFNVPIDLSGPNNISKQFYHSDSWTLGFCLKAVGPEISGNDRNRKEWLDGFKGQFSIKDPNGSEIYTDKVDSTPPSDHQFCRTTKNELVIGVTNPNLRFDEGEHTLDFSVFEGAASLSGKEASLILTYYRYGPEDLSATMMSFYGVVSLIISGVVLSWGLRISKLTDRLLKKSEQANPEARFQRP